MNSQWLRSQAVTTSTNKKYLKAAKQFLHYLTVTHQQHKMELESDVDELMCEYINLQYSKGESKSACANTVFGMIHLLPSLKLQLNGAMRSLKGWGKLEPTIHKPPITWEVTCTVATTMIKAGHIDAAIATLVGFQGYLRISEIFSLRCNDVSVPNDSRLGVEQQHTALRLRACKTGSNQSAIIYDKQVAVLLHMIIGTRTSTDQLVFSISEQWYRTILKYTLTSLGLSHIGYTPHSLRHGAATRDYLSGVQLIDILQRGRWANTKSITTYVQSSRALLLSLHIPASVHEAGKLLSTQLISAFLPFLPSPTYALPTYYSSSITITNLN